ncbi:Vacuolar amino acid transporter 1 [Morella rubra]|uniref:Vacuolar amino acid transporter 1 n=1 Tax=Morella rubra TaxID=262757 RepID=A0A6A1VB04_9ROSI|nr:Vacuolar amino acid transporter 1 [Morella rubra]
MESQDQLPQSEQQGKGTTFLKTCFNGINALAGLSIWLCWLVLTNNDLTTALPAGVGILSIPYALSQGGWLSLMLLFLVASLCCYTGLLIQRCMEANPVIKSYPDIGEIAFGSKGRAMISAFMYLELYLIAVEFLILDGDSLEKLFPNMGFKIAGLKVGGKRAFVLLTALVILPTTWLKNLGVMAYLSAGGVLATIAVVVCVLWTGVGEGVGFHEGNMFVDVGGLPTAISLFTFCYSGHAVFPTLCNSMKDRSQFSKVLLVCFLVSTISYGFMGIIGYLMYGDILKSQVTLNLPIRKITTSIAIYTTLISPLTKYAVIITPIATAIEEKFSFGKIRVIVSSSGRCL